MTNLLQIVEKTWEGDGRGGRHEIYDWGGNDDEGSSVLSDILDYEGVDVWDKVLAEIYLMQERVAKFQAGLTQFKNTMENIYLDALGAHCLSNSAPVP